MSAGPAHRVQSAVVEYGFPTGHLGHLTTEEEAALKNFKVLCAEKAYYKSPQEDGTPATHEDATLLRFLRARRFVVLDAWEQFKDTEDWRKANQIDELYETIDLAQYEETRRLYPQWTGRRDRRGIPIYVFEVKHLNSKTMAAYEKSAVNTKTKATTDGKTSPKLMRLFALYENLIRFTMPLCSIMTDRDHPRTPITQSNNIVDISGVGLKQFWNLRTHMQDASTLATAHYPETLDRIFIIGAPAFFPTVWGWIKKWFDPITTSKIFILSSSDMNKTLESFIDPANIPKKYGGQLDYTFGEQPTLDPALKDVLKFDEGFTTYPQGPIYWVPAENGKDIRGVAVGNTDSKQRKQEFATATVELQDVKDIGVSASKPANGHATNPQHPPTATQGSSRAEPEVATAAAASKDTEPVTNERTAPSAQIATANTTPQEPKEQLPATAQTLVVVEEGKIVAAARPEPVTFVTATEDLSTLNHNKENTTVPSTSPAPQQNGSVRPGEVSLAEHLKTNGTTNEDSTAAVPTSTAPAVTSETKNEEQKDSTLHRLKDKIEDGVDKLKEGIHA